MKKGFIIAAAAWLASLAIIFISYSIFQPNQVHITWSLREFLDPFKFITAGLPSLALILLLFALALIQNHPHRAKTMVQMSFGILVILSLTGVLSVFGLLMAPAAWFAHNAMAGNGQAKTA